MLASSVLMPSGKLHIVPLGGLGEFGMNCMAVRWGDDIIVIDAGLMFPEAELLGVDIVVPDITYLLENREHVRAIVLTHGHEDHIGGLPSVLAELNVPVYGTEFTLAYVEGKLEEHGLLDDAKLIEIRAGDRLKIGPFTVHPIQVTHCLVDCVALAIHTPMGIIIHTGDFKVDPTPRTIASSTCTASRNTAKKACWRCSRTLPTWSGPATRRVNAPCAANSTKSSHAQSAGCSSPASRPRSTASSWPLKWPSNTVERLRSWAAR